MLSKLTGLTFILLLNYSVFSQERFGSTKGPLEKIKTNGLQVSVDDLSEDMDAHLRSSFEKY